MLARALSAGLAGVGAYLIVVEADICPGGLPCFNIVGLPGSAVREARERVVSAIRNSGFRFPVCRVTINLAPADRRKAGAALDLPIAISILAASKQIPLRWLSDTVFLGELALDGTLRPVRGVLALTRQIAAEAVSSVCLPHHNCAEATIIQGVKVYPVESVRAAAEVATNGSEMTPAPAGDPLVWLERGKRSSVDLTEVRGQERAKRALAIAAAGGHNIIMIGPPGSGKTMLARRLPTVLPPMTLDETVESSMIHSVAGLLPEGIPLLANRPFRAPHHTVSRAGLVGGGSIPRPGEVSLAHNGVLFLDEVTEFTNSALEALRQPLEDKQVSICRVRERVSFPASFTLAAACNPCPCGFLGDPKHHCRCTPSMIHRYYGKLSGPLLDRIDLQIEVPAVSHDALTDRDGGESSAQMRERVCRARERQVERFRDQEGVYCNAQMVSRHLPTHCRLDPACGRLLGAAMERMGFSARAHDRVIRVARTIADLDGSEAVLPPHVSEAIQYRCLDRVHDSVASGHGDW